MKSLPRELFKRWWEKETRIHTSHCAISMLGIFTLPLSPSLPIFNPKWTKKKKKLTHTKTNICSPFKVVYGFLKDKFDLKDISCLHSYGLHCFIYWFWLCHEFNPFIVFHALLITHYKNWRLWVNSFSPNIRFIMFLFKSLFASQSQVEEGDKHMIHTAYMNTFEQSKENKGNHSQCPLFFIIKITTTNYRLLSWVSWKISTIRTNKCDKEVVCHRL